MKKSTRALSLVELLAVIAIVGVLAMVVSAAVGNARQAAQRTACLSNLRQLTTAVHLYCQEHDGTFPRSNHSAFGYRERNWLWTIQPYLINREPTSTQDFNATLEQFCRCPVDERTHGSSYGLNVFFELAQNDRQIDEYTGAPRTWRSLPAIREPARTILLAELKSSETTDHIMAHFWAGDGTDTAVAIERHNGQSHYAFVDGHIERLPVQEIFNPAEGVNRWHPDGD